MKRFKVLAMAVIFLLLQLWGITAFFETGYAQPDYSIGYNSCSEGTSKTQWVDEAGNIKWPANRGFAGDPVKTTLKPGTRIDRYGYEGGTFVSPEGTPYANRALAPGTETKPYNVYEVVKPVEVQGGKIAPWFDQPGGGIQYEFSQSISDLLKAGIIKKVGP